MFFHILSNFAKLALVGTRVICAVIWLKIALGFK